MDKPAGLILASNSPRRKELLIAAGFEFETDCNTDFVESFPPGTPPESVPELLSEGKSLGFHRALGQGEILLTADTVVILGEKIMGKPKDRNDACAMLRELSGRRHSVVTAVTLRSRDAVLTRSDKATVEFKSLSEAEIEYYIDRFKPYDKAGAYGIQEWIGYIGIPRIEGSFYTVMGLPIHLVYSMLNEIKSI